MWRAVGHSVGRAKLKMKADKRRRAVKNLWTQWKRPSVRSGGPTCTGRQERLGLCRKTSCRKGLEYFSLSCIFFFPFNKTCLIWVKFCSSCCFNKCHTEQHEISFYLFSIPGVAKPPARVFLSALLTSHVSSAVSPNFLGCVPAVTLCAGVVTQEAHPLSSLVSILAAISLPPCLFYGSSVVKVKLCRHLPIN